MQRKFSCIILLVFLLSKVTIAFAIATSNPASQAYVDRKVATLQALIDRATLIKIGDSYGGGIVYFLDNSVTPRRGLIAAESDATAAGWSSAINNVSTSNALYAGSANTANMLAQSGGSAAATQATTAFPNVACATPIIACSNWYLPSQNELQLLWANQGIAGISTSFSNYWSSTQFNNNFAIRVSFADGSTSFATVKSQSNNIRPVRSFTY